MSPRARARSSRKPGPEPNGEPAATKDAAEQAIQGAAEGAAPEAAEAPVKARPARARRSRRLPTDGTLPPLAEILPPAQPESAVEPEALPAEPSEGDEGEPSNGHARVRLATAEELEDWDVRAVGSRNGHVFQSRAWADHAAAHGLRPWYLVYDDGFRLLVLGREGGMAGGGTAYASRGPIPEGDPEVGAGRAAAAAELLARDGFDPLTVDGEWPASSGLGHQLREAGFEPVEELQASRHRMDIRLGPDDAPNSDEKTIFSSFVAHTRNLIRQAERHALRVRRLDAGGGRIDDASPDSLAEEFDAVQVYDASAVDAMLRTFYSMLSPKTRERGFAVGSEATFLDWSRRAMAAGHLIYLQAEHPTDGPIAGATFYRHGHRLTYSLAGHDPEQRRKFPGAVHLLVWRGIQIALDERRTSVDLGGVDVEGARGKPNKGHPTYDEYQFRESFGARWVELTGAHRKGRRPAIKRAGRRVLGRLAALRR